MTERMMVVGQHVIVVEDVAEELAPYAGAVGEIREVYRGTAGNLAAAVRLFGFRDERTFEPAELDVRRCRECGCDQLHACDPPCAWVERNLCSRCASPEALRRASRRPVRQATPLRERERRTA